MTSLHRCSRGHTWELDGKAAPASSCPECGAAVLFVGPNERRETRDASPPPHVVSTVPQGSPPAGDDTTGFFLNGPTPDPAPSFASLVGLPSSDLTSPSSPNSDTGVPIPRPVVPGYEIIGEIGRGGMGIVYMARQLALNRIVALKMILAGSHAGPVERERFRREAEAAAALQHPNIVQIFEIGEAAGHPYLALEMVEGGSLAQHLDGSPWPAADAAKLVEQLARAMHFAHEHGIVHRDLKPGNVLIQGARVKKQEAREFQGNRTEEREEKEGKRKEQPPGSGRLKRRAARFLGSAPPPSPLHPSALPKITDFGLAKRLDETVANQEGTRTGAVLGTPSYIAPEQASGKGRDIGPATDVYALGAVLYELLTGRPPFKGETPLDTVLQVVHDDPVPPKQLHPKMPRDLETICLKCLMKSPARRYPSALALADDLRRFLAGEPIRARPVSAWGRGVKWARRHPALAALLSVTTLAVAAVVVVLAVAYSHVRAAIADKEAETRAANKARDLAHQLADENETARREAEKQAERLQIEADRTRRAAYALQLAQVAAMVERDPSRAGQLLDDESRCPSILRDFTWHYLRRLCKREERKYEGHGEESLYAVAVSPDGRLVATGGKDNVIHIWDPRTGTTLATLAGHRRWVTSLSFRPDGRALASSGADGTIRLWRVPAAVLGVVRQDNWVVLLARRVVKAVRVDPAVVLEDVHEGAVNAIAFSPDGRSLASGGQDGVVRLWELGRWRAAEPDHALAGGAGATVWAHDHDRTNPTARPVWELRSLPGNTAAVVSLAFAAGGRVLASGASDGGVRLWAADGSALLRDLPAQVEEPVLAVALTPDGRKLAVTNNGPTPQVFVWDTETWAAPRRLIGHTAAVYSLSAGPDGLLLASAGFDRSVRLWDLELGREKSVLMGHAQNVRGVVFSPDRRTLLTASMDGSARVWRVGVRGYDSVDVEHDGETMTAAAVSDNGETLVAGGPERTVRVWALDTAPGGRRVPDVVQVRGVLPAVPLIDYQLPSRVLTVAATPDGRVVLAGCAEGVYVWRMPQLPMASRSGGPKRITLPIREPKLISTPRPVYGLATHSDGKVLAVVSDDGVRLWDLRLMRPLRAPMPGGRIIDGTDVREVAFGPHGRHLAVAAGDSLKIVNAATGAVAAEVLKAHGGASIDAVAFDPLGQTVATADSTGLIKLWRLDGTGAAMRISELADLTAHTEAVHTLAFSPDGRTLASGGWDRSVVLWDPVTGQERASLPDHADRVLRVQFTADGRALMTASRDGLVKRWKVGRE